MKSSPYSIQNKRSPTHRSRKRTKRRGMMMLKASTSHDPVSEKVSATIYLRLSKLPCVTCVVASTLHLLVTSRFLNNHIIHTLVLYAPTYSND